MMKRWFGIALACCLACPVRAVGDTPGEPSSDDDSPGSTCSRILKQLRADVVKNEARRIPLREPALHVRSSDSEGMPCENFDQASQSLHQQGGLEIERGRLGGHRAAVFTDGPHGSGHYWDLTLAIEVGGQIAGACLTTKTAGWRNIPTQGVHHFPKWRTIVGDRFYLWAEGVAGSSEWESLIEPLVFRIEKRALVLDRTATMTEIGRFAKSYAALSAMRQDHARELHRAAAAAYGAFSTGADCPR